MSKRFEKSADEQLESHCQIVYHPGSGFLKVFNSWVFITKMLPTE